MVLATIAHDMLSRPIKTVLVLHARMDPNKFKFWCYLFNSYCLEKLLGFGGSPGEQNMPLIWISSSFFIYMRGDPHPPNSGGMGLYIMKKTLLVNFNNSSPTRLYTISRRGFSMMDHAMDDTMYFAMGFLC